MIVAGIDEAGYGPLLGPLVVAGTVFEVPDAKATPDLWRTLARSVTQSPAKGKQLLPIADSKKLHNRKNGLAVLERTALAMLATASRRPRTLRGLLRVVAPDAADALDTLAWYRGFDPPLPRTVARDAVGLRANAVGRDMASQSVRLASIHVAPLIESEFNRRVEQTRNKATVLLELALRIVQRILNKHPHGVRIHVDRHGGREHYVDKLLTFFENAELRVVEECDARSAYEIRTRTCSFSIEFATKGESKHLPIALASIYAKYIRELLMEAINAYFRERAEGLKPTAGYYTDALRFLSDIDAVIDREHIDRNVLVRSR